MLISNHLEKYKPALLSLRSNTELTKEQLLVDDFLMERNGQLEIYYAPHNEYVNVSAKVLIVGITPGWTQMKIAFEEARKGLEKGLSNEEICKRAQQKARFAGTMRNNLVSMLDELGLHQHLNITSSADMFLEDCEILHSGSLLRFPVFAQKKNYTGAHPNLLTNSFLLNFARIYVEEELILLNSSLIIPLGKTVETILRIMEREGKLDGSRCLWGFPHPSGANGHRYKQFAANFNQMKNVINTVFSRSMSSEHGMN